MDNQINELSTLLSQSRPYLVLAPPRSSSTALARALIQHSKIHPYIHEPCDLYCHSRAPVSSISERLRRGGLVAGTLIKAMTFQMGTADVCRAFLRNVHHPILILVRDPLLCIESRLRMVLQDLRGDQPPNAPESFRIGEAIESRDYRNVEDVVTEDRFPIAYTGWDALAAQVDILSNEGIDYEIVTARTFRSRPEQVLMRICSRMGIPFEPAMLHWPGSDDVSLGSLPDQHDWYDKVLKSRRVIPEKAPTFEVENLPRRFQQHTLRARDFYTRLIS